MKHIRVHGTTALLLTGIMLISTAVFGQSAIEKQAQELLNAGKYKACAALLEKEVKKSNVSISVLRIAMNANLRSGNPMTAAILAAKLLQQSGKDNLDSLFEAAQTAELSGDDKLAVSRYNSYVLKAQDRKDVENRLAKALSYVLWDGFFPEAFQVYAKRMGTSLTWKTAQEYLSGLIRQGNFKALYPMIRFSLNTYRDVPDVASYIIRSLYEYRNSFHKRDIPHLLDVLTLCRYPERKFEQDNLYRLIAHLYSAGDLEPHTAFRYARRFIEDAGLTPADGRIFTTPADKYLKKARELKTVDQAAAEIIDVGKFFLKGNNPGALQLYLQLILNNQDVFKSRFKPRDLGKLAGRLSELQKTKYSDTRNYQIFNQFVNKFYKDDKDTEKAIEFALALLPYATPEMARWLFDIDPENARSGRKDSWIDPYLDAKNISPFEQKLRGMQVIGSLAQSGSSARFATALRNTILSSNYDPSYLLGLIRQSKISGAELAGALNGAFEKQGFTVKMENMVDFLTASEYKKDAKLQALKSSLKRKTAGSDPVYSAAARVFEAKEPEQIENAVAKFLAAAKSVNVPSIPYQAANLHEYTAYQVLQQNRRLWGRNESAKLMVQRFLPKMNMPGKEMYDLLSRAWTLDGASCKGGLFYQGLKSVLPAIVAHPGAPPLPVSISSNIQPEGKDISLFSGHYGHMAPVALYYILYAADSWSKDYFFKQVESLMNSPDAQLERNHFYYMRNRFLSKDFKYHDQIPVSTFSAVLKKIINTGKADKKIDLDLEMEWLRATNQKQRNEVLAAYAAALKVRSHREQMAAFNEVYRNILSDNDPASGIAFADIALKPLLDQWPLNRWHQVPINSNMFGFFYSTSISKDKKIDTALKASAGTYYRALRNAFLKGSASFFNDYNMGRYAEALLPGLESFAKSGNLTAINRAAVMIGFALDKENSVWRGSQVAEKALKALEKTPPQLQYVFLNCFATGNSPFNNDMKQKYSLAMAKLAKDIPGLVPVNKTDAAYNLFLAQQMKQEGNALQAWAMVRGKFPVLVQRWKEFDLDFVFWVVNQARKTKMFKEALELSQTIWMDENKLSPADAAKLGLSKGDTYRDWKNYPAARIEYESLTNNKRYAKTEGGRLAKFRLIELLILTEDYGTARTMLERLQEARSLQDQAEAFYLLARIDFENQDYESAMDHLAEVFLRNYAHEEGRLLEGEIMLKTNKITRLELELGMKQLATILIPGKPLNLMIQDMNLAVIRGGKTLPVVVSTTSGKDSEAVELLPNPQDPTKFTASLPTVIGKAVPNNMILELNGNDRIIYQIDSKFQKENGINRQPNKLELRYPAKLYASSMPILSIEQQEQLALFESLKLTKGGVSRVPVETILRPGGTIYLRVVDLDMSCHPDKPDSVFVDISCSSGDVLNHFELKETGDCTGVFDAKVPTGIPFPNVTVSDSVEGIDINAVINSTKSGSWKSLSDGVCPKWIEIDTMTSSNFKEATLTLPNPATVKYLRVYGILGSDEEELAVFPRADQKKQRGGLRVQIREGYRADLNGQRDLFRGAMEEGIFVRQPVFTRDLSPKYRGQDRQLIYKMSGVFHLPENQEIEFKFLQESNRDQRAYLLIDGKLLFGGLMNASGLMTSKRSFLQKGIHTIQVFTSGYSRNSAIKVGMLQPDGSYEPLPANWFSIEKNPSLAEYLKPKGVIDQTPTGFRITLTKPLRYRKLKWVFDDFSGSQMEVTGATIVNDKGKRIIPAAQDLSSGKSNRILEIAPADSIIVKYEDQKRLNDNKAILSQKLSSSFSNASIGFLYEEIKMDEDGRASRSLCQAARVSLGDDVIVRVSDIDEDRTDGRESVKADIVTSSGEKLTLELLEGEGGDRGNFMETFRIGKKTDPARRILKVVPGDRIQARYLDKENDAPGIPFVRIAEIVNNEGSRPELTVFDTKIELVEDRSRAALARIQSMKNRGDKRADIKLYKERINALPIRERHPRPSAKKQPGAPEKEEVFTINSKTPLLLELTCPGYAKHSGSKVNVEVLTGTEIAAAESERREPNPLRVEMGLTSLASLAGDKGYNIRVDRSKSPLSATESNLEAGLFSGIVRLQLGSPNDEINDLVGNDKVFNLLDRESSRLDSDAFKVPTVIVSGSDRIYVSFKDKSGKTLIRKSLRLRSDGEIALFDKTYLTPEKSIHLGQHFHVRVYDPDRDITAEQDKVDVDVVSKTGDKVKLKLTETLPHSGIFTGSLKVDLKPSKPLEGQTTVQKLDSTTLWSKFGDKVEFSYTDLIPLHSITPQKISVSGEVLIGSDGELAAFTKRFKDPDMAVKTNFLMAEALFEMAKSHKAIKGPDNQPDPEKQAQAKQEIAKGKRVLEEALRDYPDTALKAQGDFLLANLSLQLEDYTSALSQFSSVISKYPDSEYAPRSYFQKAVCYEKLAAKDKDPRRKLQKGDLACEEFVRLTYLYPNTSFATDAKLRLGNYYYKTKRYRLAASVLEKFGEAYPENPYAPKALLLAGFASLRNEDLKVKQAKQLKRTYIPDYTPAIRIFNLIDKHYEGNKTERPQAMYFAGDALFKQKEFAKAYQYLQRLVWDYPESKWAKIARGRMAANPIQ